MTGNTHKIAAIGAGIVLYNNFPQSRSEIGIILIGTLLGSLYPGTIYGNPKY